MVIAERLTGTGGNLVLQQFIQYALTCVQPGLDCFERQLAGSLKDLLLAFKSASYFSPQKISVIQPNADSMSSLSVFPFFSAEVLESFKAELPTYLAKATDVAPNLSCLDWWKKSENSLPPVSYTHLTLPTKRIV